jgi:prepilin-type N-terminal cleavage/methylation domain-containing protein
MRASEEAMRRSREGFTLIELLIVVVVIGILAAIAIPKFSNTKEKAMLAGMKSDLRNLLTEQEGFFSDYNAYASAFGLPGSAAQVAFMPSGANTLTILGGTATGWSAEITNPGLKGSLTKCGIYVGNGAAPNAMVNKEGVPACY